MYFKDFLSYQHLAIITRNNFEGFDIFNTFLFEIIRCQRLSAWRMSSQNSVLLQKICVVRRNCPIIILILKCRIHKEKQSIRKQINTILYELGKFESKYSTNIAHFTSFHFNKLVFAPLAPYERREFS